MFRSAPLPVFDLESLPESKKSHYLKSLREEYPTSTCFLAGYSYLFQDETGHCFGARITKNLHLICENETHFAWYIESERGALFNGEMDDDCYLISMRLLSVFENADPTLFPSWRTRYVVNVDFNKPNSTPAAQYLASMLPTLSKSYLYSHYRHGMNTLKIDRDVDIHLTLSHDLIPRESSKYPGEVRFALAGAHLGGGTFVDVYNNPITLRVGKDGLFQSTQKPRVARYGLVREPGNPESGGIREAAVKREDTILLQMKERFKAKPSFFKIASYEPSRKALIRFEKRLPGVDLRKMIDGEIGGLRTWGLVPRLRLAIAVLRAIDEQVHQKGVIHCDIKPENIMVADWDTESPVVNVIDFNLSRLKADRTILGGIGGTPLYLAPERCTGTYIPDERSDAFAAGITAAELFGHDFEVTDNIDELFGYLVNYQFTFGLDGELNKYAIEAIKNELMTLVHPIPALRQSLLGVVSGLQFILRELLVIQQFNRPKV